MNTISKSHKTRLASLLASMGLLLAFLLLVGCETLNFTNPNAADINSASIQTLVTGAESEMREELDIYIQATMTLGREGYFWEPADPRFTGELLFGDIDPGGFLSERPWSARYRVVEICNELLRRAQNIQEPATKAGIEAFARTIRAYQLLLTLNYVDQDAQGRSIKLIDFDTEDALNEPFVNRATALAFIETELNAANTALAAAGSTFSFQLSSGFANFNTPATFAQFNRALAARVLVYSGKFNEALTALQGSFINPGGSLTAGVYHIYGTGAGDSPSPVFEDPTAAFVKLRAHKSFETDAEPGDLRFSSKTFRRANVEVFDGLSTDLVAVLAQDVTSPYPIIRNEELILLRAEANVGLGNFAAAEADMNIVRAAAGLAPYSGTNAGNGLSRLLYEKRYSLFGEGHRWVDLRRYGLLNTLPIDRPARGDKHIARMEIPEDEFPER
jgi:hypothetical protein